MNPTSIIISHLSVNACEEFGDHFRTKLKIKESVSTKERLAVERLPDMSFIFTERKGPNSTRVLTVQGFTEFFGEEGSGKTPYLRTCPRLVVVVAAWWRGCTIQPLVVV